MGGIHQILHLIHGLMKPGVIPTLRWNINLDQVLSTLKPSRGQPLARPKPERHRGWGWSTTYLPPLGCASQTPMMGVAATFIGNVLLVTLGKGASEGFCHGEVQDSTEGDICHRSPVSVSGSRTSLVTGMVWPTWSWAVLNLSQGPWEQSWWATPLRCYLMGVTVNLEIRGVEVRPEPPHRRIKGPHSAPAFKAIPSPWGGHLPHYDGPFQPPFPKGTLPAFSR